MERTLRLSMVGLYEKAATGKLGGSTVSNVNSWISILVASNRRNPTLIYHRDLESTIEQYAIANLQLIASAPLT